MKRTLKIKYVFLFLLSIVFLSSCFTERINKMMKSWTRAHYGNLIASWGPPQMVFDDGYGGRILIYTTQRVFIAPGKSTTYTTGSATAYDNYIWGSATSNTYYTPSRTYGYTAYRMFWINKEGYIYRWAWRGL